MSVDEVFERVPQSRAGFTGEQPARDVVRVAKFHAPEVIIGRGALAEIPRAAEGLGLNRLLIVSDRGIVSTPWFSELSDRLHAAGIHTSSFTGISPNPRAGEVVAGLERYGMARCDGIVALGGGSVIDAAKGVAILAANGGHILEYEGIDKARHPLPPLLAAPTTAGSGSDVSQFCIISDSDRMTKVAIIGRGLVPDVSVIDPRVFATMPPEVAAQSGMDAVSHCVEAYASRAHTRLTDGAALSAIGTAWRSLERLVDSPADSDAGMDMAYAALQAGMAFTNAILGATHALSHPVGGMCDAPHGAINAIILPHVIRFNAQADPSPYVDLARAIGLPESPTPHAAAERFADEMARLTARVGLPQSLSAFGVQARDIPSLTVNALADACMRTNPRRPTVADVAAMYHEAL
ncbi:MAG: iron-containing alcohol dehydrogenase [Gordonia sp.]|uniref:iron-containing alcohol dehydrogenase n=1 Tax=Gordonia sp. (in: high G+C Gram-positive bacteria) TaxID=84139 RepID=UPI001D5E932A|nr:iron-containing alcohol dehydrogenase [Gordonia sp. (in: high G+C Gram-positive bacteria)]MCB1296048.1 iron-containing alcohol dehydrogenase [Gordonia sp. (in: high G+C Gram-positive bacteria)]HMS77666.1 iron-containing alcohol dehydrogenase [Gordonia sp. (in: high G+C Gram-positive bacteria)]